MIYNMRSKNFNFTATRLRDGPLEKLWGGGAGEVQKNIRAREIKWKKIHARQLILKNIHALA